MSAVVSTARVHRHRERQRSGVRVFAIAVDEILLVERLIEVRLLQPAQRDDQAAIAEAASRFLAAALSE